MRLYLCDLCGCGSDKEFEHEVVQVYNGLEPRPTNRVTYHICKECADKVTTNLKTLSENGKLKRDKVVAVAIGTMDQLY